MYSPSSFTYSVPSAGLPDWRDGNLGLRGVRLGCGNYLVPLFVPFCRLPIFWWWQFCLDPQLTVSRALKGKFALWTSFNWGFWNNVHQGVRRKHIHTQLLHQLLQSMRSGWLTEKPLSSCSEDPSGVSLSWIVTNCKWVVQLCSPWPFLTSKATLCLEARKQKIQ